MWNLFLDFLFPRHSLTGSEGALITEEERGQLKAHPVTEEKETLIKRGLNHIDCIRAATVYGEVPLMKKAIETFKYKRVPGLAEELARLMDPQIFNANNAALCPVPLHWSRRFQRGFNQSDLLASHIGARLNVPVFRLLKRIRATGHQAWRGRKERLTAVRNAFQCCTSEVPKKVILIDDLATTGATLDACADALKKAGVERVEGWVVAHG